MQIKDKIQFLGGRITTDWRDATHLMMKPGFRTKNMFICLTMLDYIVDNRWLVASLKKGEFLDAKDYCLRDQIFENTYETTIAEVLAKPNRKELFRVIQSFKSLFC